MNTIATRPTSLGGHRPVPSCPTRVVSFLSMSIAELGDSPDGEFIALLVRLCTDPQMEDVWKATQVSGMNEHDYLGVMMAFYSPMLRVANHDYAFEKKTNKERIKWLHDVRNTVCQLQSLLEEGPGLTSENVIECIPPADMRWILGVLGVQIVPDEIGQQCRYDEASGRWQVTEWTVRRMQECTEPLSLTDLLETLLEELDKGVPSTQTVKKPRDAKAFRANYILRVTERINAAPFHLTDEQVAAVARVALRDEAITPALANRFRWRPEKDVPLGAVIQDSSDQAENVDSDGREENVG